MNGKDDNNKDVDHNGILVTTSITIVSQVFTIKEYRYTLDGYWLVEPFTFRYKEKRINTKVMT